MEVVMQELITVALASAGSLIALFFLAKLMGYRQLSQMSMFDYINGITIGSIAAEMATSLEDDFMKPLVAMIVYAVLVTVASILEDKSVKMRRFLAGKPTILYDRDTLYFANLKKAKLDLGEFLMLCRVSGYFDLSKIETVILEANGQLSFLPKVEERPLTPKDMNLSPEQERLVANIIIDGNVMQKNLQHIGKDERWLNKQLSSHNIKDVKEVFLATCDAQNQVSVYRKEKGKMNIDILD